MNYWIFQCNPERFDLRSSRKVADRAEDDWPATRYRSDMRAGDRVFFWMSGPVEIRGIHAVGSLTGEPEVRGDSHRVTVRYERLLKPHVPISAIESESSLQNLWILRMAFGTNFLINRAEGEAIETLIKRISP